MEADIHNHNLRIFHIENISNIDSKKVSRQLSTEFATPSN